MNPEVDAFLLDGCGRCSLVGTPECKVNTWREHLTVLRKIALACGLTEERKWGMPCYTYNGKNVFLLAAFKEYCSISFFKGALLKNESNLLTSPGENSQAVRQFRFTELDDIISNTDQIKAFIFEAIELEKSGAKIEFSAKKELEFPNELYEILNQNPALKEAFEALTPGRKRGYALHFSQPKQAKTRVSRIENCIPKIMAGKGFQDR